MSGQNRRPPDPSPTPATVGIGSPATGNQMSPTAGSQQPSPTPPAGQGTEESEKLKKRISDQEKEITRAQMKIAELERQTTQKVKTEGERALAEAFSNYVQDGNANGQMEITRRIAREEADVHARAYMEMATELSAAQKALEGIGETLEITPDLQSLAARVKSEYRQSGINENCWLGALAVQSPAKFLALIQKAKMQGENEALGKASTESAGRIEKPGVPQTSSTPTGNVMVGSLGQLAMHKMRTMKNAKGEPIFPSFYKE